MLQKKDDVGVVLWGAELIRSQIAEKEFPRDQFLVGRESLVSAWKKIAQQSGVEIAPEVSTSERGSCLIAFRYWGNFTSPVFRSTPLRKL